MGRPSLGKIKELSGLVFILAFIALIGWITVASLLTRGDSRPVKENAPSTSTTWSKQERNDFCLQYPEQCVREPDPGY